MAVLGSGGYGTVILCEHKNSKLRVAVKHIKKAKLRRSFGQTYENFHELEVMERVCRSQVPGLLDLLDSFEDKDNFYTVTKYMPSCDLQKFLLGEKKKVRFSEAEVKEIMHQLVLAVKELHSKNVLHRDIKLSNILVSKDLQTKRLQVKLADFGSAKILASPTAKHEFSIGTMGFMAPEAL